MKPGTALEPTHSSQQSAISLTSCTVVIIWRPIKILCLRDFFAGSHAPLPSLIYLARLHVCTHCRLMAAPKMPQACSDMERRGAPLIEVAPATPALLVLDADTDFELVPAAKVITRILNPISCPHRVPFMPFDAVPQGHSSGPCHPTSRAFLGASVRASTCTCTDGKHA